ncbi:complement C1q-like protein 4 [Oreochromis aureus]|uniref:complement C1q-like protein 4 n=1 Tax=Oreochromis aureus TaxID=47969 RepID=UPI0012BC0200|nr:complement C1q-like protein 4 [Oreochromis aureus]
MRAIVLLCLLHAAFGQGNIFSWIGPSESLPQQAPVQSQVCVTDQASCGCCLMQKQIGRLEKFFNMSINALKDELMSSKMILNNMRGSRSAFSVALNNNSAMAFYGPFSSDSIIKYKHVFINLGDGYNVETGVFTVPRSGVYSLSVTIYSSARVTLSNCVTLQVNSENVAEAIERNGQDLEDSTSVVVAVQLNARDRLSVKLLQGCSLSDDINHYNTFTGFLLYASD